MRLIKFLILHLLPFLLYSKVHAQTVVEEIEEELLQYLAENIEEDMDIGEVSENLLRMARNPINLNTANRQQLSGLYILSPLQINNLLEHRRITGSFVSLMELQGIDGFDIPTIRILANFVKISPPSSLADFDGKSMWNQSEQEVMLRYGRFLQKSRGYLIKDPEKSRYLGSIDRISMRYRFNYQNKLRISLNMSKDAGEPFFDRYQKYGFDFLSGSISLRDIGRAKQVVVGDFALQLGQGLVVWNGLSFGKGGLASSMSKQGAGLKPYTSMNENQFLRGTAISYSFNRLNVIGFFSIKKVDGRVDEVGGAKLISSLSVSGLHRTPNEINNRKAVLQKVWGSHLNYTKNRLNIGTTFMMTHWDGDIVKGNTLRNVYDFEGRSLTSLSFNYDYTYKNIYTYGETAHSLKGGLATVNGVIASLDPKLSVFVNQRYYQKNYWQFYAQGVGETSQVRNEKGIYSGMVYHPSRKINAMFYVDIFKFPWLRFRSDAPSHGVDFLTQFQYIWYKKGKATIRYRHRLRQENGGAESATSESMLEDIVRQQLRLEFQYQWSARWTTRSRGEYQLYFKEMDRNQRGILLYQDVFYKPGFINKLQINWRLAMFKTDSYETRLYAYENNVLYASSFPAYYQKGWRGYINLRYKISRNLDLWGRYAGTWLGNEETIGSGLDLIEGNKKTEVTLQVRWRL